MKGRSNSRDWMRIRGLVRKETRQIRRDPSSLLVAVLLPLILLFLFGYGISLDPRFFKIGLVVEQWSPEASSFTTSLLSSPVFRIEVARDRREFEDQIISGEIRAIVVVPADFSARLRRGEEAPIQAIIDGTDPNTAGLVEGYLELLWANWATGEAVRQGAPPPRAPAAIEPRFWYNSELLSRYSLVPGSMAIILTLIGSLLTALVVVREWERGTMEALLATPLRRIELIVGKIAPYFLLGMGSMALATAVAVFLFHIPFRGSLFVLAVVSAAFMLASLGQGMLISTVTRSQLVAAQASILSAFLPAFYFSDFVFELDSMPWPLQVISYAVPARYYVSALQSLFLAGNIWPVVLGNLAALSAIAFGFLLLTGLFTRMRLE